MTPQRASYWALLGYLRQQPLEMATLTLTLAALEEVMGGRLPVSAVLPGFWAAGIIAEGTWKQAGFSARLDRAASCVTFSRETVGTVTSPLAWQDAP